jgi:hypothetical protein
VTATRKTKVNNVVFINRDRGYRFQDRDPAMEELCDLIHKSGLTVSQIVEETYKATHGVYAVSPGTISHWLAGKTVRPQNFTMTWVGFALGYQRKWTKI